MHRSFLILISLDLGLVWEEITVNRGHLDILPGPVHIVVVGRSNVFWESHDTTIDHVLYCTSTRPMRDFLVRKTVPKVVKGGCERC